MKSYEVWIEGYIVIEGSCKAQSIGSYKAKTFKDACVKALRKQKFRMEFYDKVSNRFWGRSLYDNETDARKTFG